MPREHGMFIYETGRYGSVTGVKWESDTGPNGGIKEGHEGDEMTPADREGSQRAVTGKSNP